ncbi:hypothetical protein [Burkholderia vietnamiensis]|uniref:hypothetical protein n=1 Tax=Burkholderia vietnamiensis TaxID=60552 RepID=UPI001ABAE9F6|nr:hypothetical protein [Burkholderia vietnamiensis]
MMSAVFRQKFSILGAVMARKTIVVTNCTNRKRAGGASVVFSTVEVSGPLTSVAACWARAVRKTRPSRLAQDVYMGRGFAEARRVAVALDSTLHIISAGLGVVSAAEPIPLYDLTVSSGANSLAPLLAQLGNDPSDWWAALTAELGAQRSVHAMLDRHPGAMVLFALSGSYVALIAQDLASLTKSQINRIRIITSSHGQVYVPDNARHIVLPYDDRLEGSSYAGTRADFPQRALRHFVEVLNGHQLSVEEARSAVAGAMCTLKRPIAPVRDKKTDAEILELLRTNWGRFGGASTHLLRYLRDEAMVACEQGRFRALWSDLRQEFALKG